MMRLALVVEVHPERRTVDLVMQDTGLRVAEAAVLSSQAHNDGGEWSVPSVQKPTSEQKAGDIPSSGRQMIAAVDTIAGRPVVVGWLHPLSGQMTFNEDDRTVNRHGLSGAYTTTAPDGSMETYHPSGAYVRIGTGPHQSLTTISADQNWVETATATAPTITVHTARFDMTIDPSGNLLIHAQGTATIISDGAMSVSTAKTLDVHAAQALTIHGDNTVGITASGAININSGSTVSVTGTAINLN